MQIGQSFMYSNSLSNKFSSKDIRVTIITAWAGLDLRGPIDFRMTPFSLQMIAFFTAWTCPKTHQTWNIQYVTPAEKFHNLLSSSISITRWCYNQGKCVLAHNSNILCRTYQYNPYIHTFTELCWILLYRPRPFPSAFFCKFAKCHKPTFSNSFQAISPIKRI